MKKYINEFRKLIDITKIIELSIITTVLLAIADELNILTKLLSNNFMIVIVALIGLLIIIRLINLNLADLIKLNIVNDIDWIYTYILFTNVLFAFSSLFIFKKFTYRIYIFLIVTLILIILMYTRIKTMQKTESTSEDTCIYDLKDLYDGKIKENRKSILIEEESVSYDLLEREIFINNFYNIIIDNKARKKFVIGLEGHWGSGKSTILNIIKNKLKEDAGVIVIDDFDPWNYNDQSSMFRAMFDTILKASNIDFSISKSKDFIDTIHEIIFDTKYGKHIKKLGIQKNEKFNEINKIKEMVNNYLNINNKKVIFIIDNIDRADKENVYLIFKLVGNILNFDNITYVLSYDDLKVKNIMNEELNIDYEYLKKIIQVQIKIPNINENKKEEIASTSIKNLLNLYGVEYELGNRYDSLIKSISSIIKDIRDLKRFLNSVITFYHRSNRNLNTIDMITIETIKMYNIELYQEIIKNKRYFISEDKVTAEDLYSDIFSNASIFNKESKKFFEDLFSIEENKVFLDLLSNIFPYVNKYKNGQELRLDERVIYKTDKQEQVNRVREKRIYSAKFFDLYFTETSNYFIKINEFVGDFINIINDDNLTTDDINIFINALEKNFHKDFFDTLYLFINKIKKEKMLDTLKILFNNIENIDDSKGFFELGARNRMCVIMSDILFIISHEELIQFSDYIRFEYSKLNIVDNIKYWIDNNKDVKEINRKEVYKLWSELHREMAFMVYDNDINIYDKYYMPGNIYGLYSGLKDSERDIKNYIKNILNTDTVIKFLFDIMSKSVGTKITYYVDKGNINSFTTEEDINVILDSKDDYTELESTIRDIYKISMEHDSRSLMCNDERLEFNEELKY